MDNLDLHLTRLAGWLLNTLGRALLLGVVVGTVAGIALGPGYIGLGGIAFALILWWADAPLPIEVDESERVS